MKKLSFSLLVLQLAASSVRADSDCARKYEEQFEAGYKSSFFIPPGGLLSYRKLNRAEKGKVGSMNMSVLQRSLSGLGHEYMYISGFIGDVQLGSGSEEVSITSQMKRDTIVRLAKDIINHDECDGVLPALTIESTLQHLKSLHNEVCEGEKLISYKDLVALMSGKVCR